MSDPGCLVSLDSLTPANLAERSLELQTSWTKRELSIPRQRVRPYPPCRGRPLSRTGTVMPSGRAGSSPRLTVASTFLGAPQSPYLTVRSIRAETLGYRPSRAAAHKTPSATAQKGGGGSQLKGGQGPPSWPHLEDGQDITKTSVLLVWKEGR